MLALTGRGAAAPHAPIVAGGVLAAAAVAQAMRAVSSRGNGVTGGGLVPSAASSGWLLAAVLVALPSLAATLPIGFRWSQPAMASMAICAANLLSLAAFHLLTIGGLIAQLVIMYRLGNRGPQLLAACLTLPFLVLALVFGTGQPPGSSGLAALAITAASAGPVAARAGPAGRRPRHGGPHHAPPAAP